MLNFYSFLLSRGREKPVQSSQRTQKKLAKLLTDLYFFLIWKDYNNNYLIFAILRYKVVLDEKIWINSLTLSAELNAESWSKELDYLNKDLHGYVKNKLKFCSFF